MWLNKNEAIQMTTYLWWKVEQWSYFDGLSKPNIINVDDERSWFADSQILTKIRNEFLKFTYWSPFVVDVQKKQQ